MTDPKHDPARADGPDVGGGEAREIAQGIVGLYMRTIPCTSLDLEGWIAAAIERERAETRNWRNLAELRHAQNMEGEAANDQLRAALAASERNLTDARMVRDQRWEMAKQYKAALYRAEADRDRLAAEVERLVEKLGECDLRATHLGNTGRALRERLANRSAENERLRAEEATAFDRGMQRAGAVCFNASCACFKRVEAARRELALTPPEPARDGGGDAQYPCVKCGKLRTKAQGGTVFTVCDSCWDTPPTPATSPGDETCGLCEGTCTDHVFGSKFDPCRDCKGTGKRPEKETP